MKQITLTAYSFNELSDKAKDKAREWMRGCVGEDYGWADGTEEDAANVGLKITGWNLDRGANCDLTMTESPERVYELILENHGEGCDTRKAAMEYRSERDRAALATEWNEDQSYEVMEAACDTFKKDLEACYLQMLRDEWEHALSDEGIDETIEANDYLFTEDGSRTAVLNA